MAKVKGIKKLTETINEWTMKNFGVTAVFGTDFQALPSNKIIQFTVLVDEDMNEVFLTDAEARFPEVHAHLFLWLLMHEIGHCMTDDIWDGDDEIYFAHMRERLDDYFPCDVYAKNEWYHAIGDEYFATKWAGCYMMEHPKKMSKFNEKINKAMIKFCRKNAITP